MISLSPKSISRKNLLISFLVVAVVSGLVLALYFFIVRNDAVDDRINENNQKSQAESPTSEADQSGSSQKQNGTAGDTALSNSEKSPDNNGNDAISEFPNTFEIDPDYKPDPEKYMEVSSDNCENECDGFSDERLRYCRIFCGLEKIGSGDDEGSCKKEEGLEKDYCLLEVSVTKKDPDICQKIIDNNIEKACKNRIAENIYEDNKSTLEE